MLTYLQPHTASHSPKRPVSSYSMSSTIRRVTPSPESLSEALSRGYAAQSTPLQDAGAQSIQGLGRTSVDERTLLPGEANEVVDDQIEHDGQDHASPAHSVNPPEDRSSLRRITPSRIPVPANHALSRSGKVGNLKRRKAGRISPSKLGAPRQHRTVLLSSPPSADQAGEKQAISAASGSQAVSAGLAMPTSPQHMPPTVPDDERARLGDFTLFPTEDPFAPRTPTSPQPIDPTRPAARHEDDYFQHTTEQYHDSDAITPLPTSPRKPIPSPWKQRVQQIGGDVHSPSPPQSAITTHVTPRIPRQASTRSVTSTFSTPGRDEMERKRGHADEGPFGHAQGLQELAERRRQVSEGKSLSQRFEDVGKRKKGTEGKGLCGCVVM